MADIVHHFLIQAPARKVFEAISTAAGIDTWWSKTCSGQPQAGATYELGFGPGYDWRARVSRLEPNREFELTMTAAPKDWQDTRVGFDLEQKDGTTQVRFHHSGWPESNEHYKVSCYCWAMYLRLLKRQVEHGEVVPYEQRLDV